MPIEVEQVDVAVVGAGLAGVIAARVLARSGKRVRVLEGRDRVGGRLLSVHTSSGHTVDLGGQWLGPGQKRMLALAQELGVATHPTQYRGKTCFEVAGALGASRAGVPLSQPLTVLGLVLAMARVERMTKRAAKHPPWPREGPAAGADTSLGAFLAERVWPTEARLILRSAFEGIFCRTPDEVSLDLALYAISSAGGLPHMQGVQGGAQERQFTAGANAVVARLALELGDRVRLGALVRRIEHRDSRLIVQSDELCVSARRVIVAIPPPLVARLEFDPPLNARRRDILRAAVMGSVVKCVLIYRTPFWRKAGLSGALWSTSGPINIGYDTTSPGSEQGILSTLAVARSAEKLRGLPAERRREAVLEALAAHLGRDARSPLEYLDLVWQDEPLSLGGYSVTLPPGQFSLGPNVFREPEGSIHFAGTETSSEYPGYMEGAVESGERAAREVLTALAGAGTTS